MKPKRNSDSGGGVDLTSRIDSLVTEFNVFAERMQRDLDHFRDLKAAKLLVSAIEERGEALICSIFDHFCEFRRDLLLGLEGNGISMVCKEVNVGCGRPDRVIYHRDGSLTVVEIKGAGDLRNFSGGLGQVLVYAEAMRDRNPGKEVRAALVVGGGNSNRKALVDACLRADVTLLPINQEAIDDFLADAYAVRCYFKRMVCDGKQSV